MRPHPEHIVPPSSTFNLVLARTGCKKRAPGLPSVRPQIPEGKPQRAQRIQSRAIEHDEVHVRIPQTQIHETRSKCLRGRPIFERWGQSWSSTSSPECSTLTDFPRPTCGNSFLPNFLKYLPDSLLIHRHQYGDVGKQQAGIQSSVPVSVHN